MKWHNFEDKIRKEVHAQKADIDVDALWVGMEGAVDVINERKKKRKGFLWFFAAGVFIFSGLIAAQFNGNADTEIAETLINTSSNNTATNTALSTPISTQKNNEYDNTTTLNNLIPEETVVLASNPSTPAIQQVDNTVELKSKVSQEGFTSNLSAQLPSISINTTRSQLPKKELNKTSGDSDYVKENLRISSAVSSDLKKIPLSAIHLLSYDDKLDDSDQPQNSNILATIAPPTEQDIQGRNPFSLILGAHVGLSFTDRQLSAKSEDFGPLVPLRNRSEQHLETINAGLDITLAHESGFSLTTGIELTDINERFRYNESVMVSDSIFGIERFIRQPDGSLDTIYGYIPNDVVWTINKEYFNKYRLIDIPLILGYQQELGAVQVGLQAGVLVNLSLETEGRVLDSPATDVDVAAANIYRTSVGFSYHFGLTVGHTLNNGLEIYAAPFARIYPKSFTAENYGLKQKYRLYGLTVGARWRF